MVELRILGEVRVADSRGSPRTSVTSRPKRLAVLGYLAATSPRGPQRRDKLLAMFWPELDAGRARAALNQTLYVLRTELGAEAIVSDGSGDVELSRSAVWCDALAFEEALDGGRAEEALELYRGDLLDGLFVSDAPDFEHWLDAERVRFRRRVSEAAWAVAEAKAGEGDAVEAARHARRAAEFSPGDETEARRLMEFLAGLGDRAAALREYGALRERLAREYELEPSAETQALVESIRQEQPITAPAPVRSQGLPEPPATHPVPAESRTADVAVAAPEPAQAGRRPRWTAWKLLGYGLGLAAIAGLLIELRPAPEPGPPVQVRLAFPGRGPLRAAGLHIAISPDGRMLVGRGNGGNGLELFLHPMDQADRVVPIPGTRGAEAPFFSPDGAWLGFALAGTIYRVPLSGGDPIPVVAVPGGRLVFPSWGPGGVILFHTPAGLWRVPAGGGEAVRFAAADTAHGEWYRFPKPLPDGRTAVFTRVDDEGPHLAIAAIGSGEVRDLGLMGTNPLFVPPDRLLYVTLEGALMTARFDPRAGRVAGPAEPTGHRTFVAMMGRAELSASQTGIMAYVPPWPTDRTLVILDRSGRAEPVRGPPRGFQTVVVAPDGRRAAVGVNDARRFNVWLLDLEAQVLEPLTSDGISLLGAWTPDAKRIAYSFNQGDGMRMGWLDADGGRTRPLLAEPRRAQFPQAITPDGRTLVFERMELGTHRDLWILPLTGDRTPRPFLGTPADEHTARLSSDGRWLAYTSDESGRDEIYVRSFPVPGPALQVSDSGGRVPRWAPGGTTLHYWSRGRMMAVELTPDRPVRVLRREVLFDLGDSGQDADGMEYDVLADGRFLTVLRGTEREEVAVEVNWLARVRSGAR